MFTELSQIHTRCPCPEPSSCTGDTSSRITNGHHTVDVINWAPPRPADTSYCGSLHLTAATLPVHWLAHADKSWSLPWLLSFSHCPQPTMWNPSESPIVCSSKTYTVMTGIHHLHGDYAGPQHSRFHLAFYNRHATGLPASTLVPSLTLISIQLTDWSFKICHSSAENFELAPYVTQSEWQSPYYDL